MGSHYYPFLQGYLFLMRRKKSRQLESLKKIKHELLYNYRIKRSPITFSIKFMAWALLPNSRTIHDKAPLQDVMYFELSFIEHIDYNHFKFVF